MTYAAQRLVYALVVVFMVVTLSFFLVRLTGDPVALIAGPEASEQQIQTIQQALRLDRPLWAQYALYVRDVARGDFGQSFFTSLPAMTMILQTLPNSIALTAVAFAIAVVVWGALTDRRWTVPVAGMLALPALWYGGLTMLLAVVALRDPNRSGGRTTPGTGEGPSIGTRWLRRGATAQT